MAFMPLRLSTWIFAIISALAGLWVVSKWSYRLEPWAVELELRTETSSMAQVYTRHNRGFREPYSSHSRLFGDGVRRTHVFPMYNQPLAQLRFDPLIQEGRVHLHAARIVDHRGALLKELDLSRFEAKSEIEELRLTDAGLEIITVPEALDPNLLYTLSRKMSPPRGWDYWSTGMLVWGGSALLLFSLFLVLRRLWALFSGILTVARGSFSGRAPPADQETETYFPKLQLGRPQRWLMALALLLLILGTRWWMVGSFGSDMPFWDQWDADAATVLIPYQEGRLNWSTLTYPHNEHRVMFTRLTSLASFLLSGQWDSRVQAMLNAFIPAATALFLFAVLANLFPGRRRLWLLWLTLLAIFALPFSWENTLGAFQSQFHYKALFAFLAIYGLSQSPFGRPLWWLGLFFACAGVYTMASGLLGAVAAGAVLVFLMIRERQLPWARPSVSLTVLILAVIALTAYRDIPEVWFHGGFGADSPGTFFQALATYLSWPVHGWKWLTVFLWLPFVVFSIAYLTRRIPRHRACDLLLGIGGWVMLIGIASAYSRGANISLPITRYADPLAYGVLVNGTALLLLTRFRNLFSRAGFGPDPIPWTRFWRGYGWLYLALAGAFLAKHSFEGVGYYMPLHRDKLDEMEMRTAAYVRTGDVEWLENAYYWGIPHPNADRIQLFVDHPLLRPILATSIREPIPWEVQEVEDLPIFVGGAPGNIERRPGQVVWGSYSVPEGVRDQTELPWEPRMFHAVAERERSYPYLFLETAGFHNGDYRGIRLVGTDPENSITALERRVQRIEDLLPAYLPIPSERYHFHAVGASRRNEWIAFTEPRSMSRVSYFAMRISGWSHWIVFSGGFLAILCLGICRTEPTDS